MSHLLASLRRVYDVEPPTGSAGDPPTTGDPIETDLLRGMRRVLDARPGASPTEATLQAVLDRAAAASSTAGPLYEAYASTAPLTGEAEVLRQSRSILDRSIASHPRLRPSSDVEALILARAAEASGVVRDVAPESPDLRPVAAAYGLAMADGAEAALLGSTRDALDRLPRHQPDATTLEAVLALAAQGAVPATAPAPDRAAAPSGARRRRGGGVWVGSAALLAVVLIAVVMNPFGESGSQLEADAETAPALASQVAPAPVRENSGDAEPQEAPAPEVSSPLVASAPQLVQRSAPRGPSATEFTPVRAERPVASPTAQSPRAEMQTVPDPTPLAEAAPITPGSVPEWNVSDDVRLLSLRLQELRRQNQGLAWDQPAEAFGAPSTAATSQPGVQAVREGSTPVRAQIRVRSDSARSNQ